MEAIQPMFTVLECVMFAPTVLILAMIVKELVAGVLYAAPDQDPRPADRNEDDPYIYVPFVAE